LSSIPRVDLASVEAIAGPGAALYGPDASNGVITLQTRDPRSEPGLTLELTVGNRRYRDVQGRYAVMLGDIGLKASGEYQSAADFQNYLNYGPVAPSTTRTPEAPINWNTAARRGNASAVYYRGEQRMELNGGLSETDGLEQTSAGRNQLVGYQARHVQLRYASPWLYASLYQLRTDAGKTFGTNAFSQNRAAFPALSADSIRALSDFPGRGTLSAGEAQVTHDVPFLTATCAVAGVQARHDQVSSERQWLSDRRTGKDIRIGQFGVYGQIESQLPMQLRLVAAVRRDDHQRYGTQVSPKAALLWSPSEDQVVRVSVNRAYKAPTIPNMDFYSPNLSRLGPGLGIGMFGNQGFTVRNAGGDILERYDPIRPEVNTTYEAGYKATFGGRFQLDAAAYRSAFSDFLTPLTTINNPARPAAQGGPTYAYDLSGKKILAPDGSEQIVLTYLNVGRATLVGADVGLRYVAGPKFSGSVNYSTTALSGLHLAPDQSTLREATSLNSPKHKVSATVESRVGAHWSQWLSVRGVTGYEYRSGSINTGRIAGFSTADVGVSRELGTPNLQVRASIQNFASCSGGRYELPITVAPPGVFVGERHCGFGITHQELINMPAIGPMMFLTLRIVH
jgi:iron complex outermembrane receptor protein